MSLRNVYWICTGLVLLLLVFDGAAGNLLTFAPDRGKVERDPASGTIRGHGTFVWFGGGYQGGK